MKKILIGNWKMNPRSALLAQKIINESKNLCKNTKSEIVICPPMPYISLFINYKGKINIGAQDVSIEKNEGAFTGEVNANILKSVGVSYVIVGHSERRARGETSSTISTKIKNVLASGMSPILCIGEKERHHDGSHFQVISHELRASLAGVSRAKAKNIVVAYEPIWAVGSKSNGAMNPEDASEAAIFIKKVLAEIFGSGAKSVRVVYGGSVDYKNASLIAHAPGISGLLVGRDSLSPAHFVKIAEAIK